jgi:hypothetical protein
MHCIVKTTTHDENADYRAEYAIFEITTGLIERINSLQAATALVQGSIDQLQALTVNDSTPMFFDPAEFFDSDADIHKYLENEIEEGFQIIDLDQFPVTLDQLTQCARRVDAPVMKMFGMWQDSIKWTGYLKHAGITFETDLITIADLKAIVDVPVEKATCLAIHGHGPATAERKEFDTEAELQAYMEGVNETAGWMTGWCEEPNDNGEFLLDEDEINGLRQNYSEEQLVDMGVIIPGKEKAEQEGVTYGN